MCTCTMYITAQLYLELYAVSIWEVCIYYTFIDWIQGRHAFCLSLEQKCCFRPSVLLQTRSCKMQFAQKASLLSVIFVMKQVFFVSYISFTNNADIIIVWLCNCQKSTNSIQNWDVRKTHYSGPTCSMSCPISFSCGQTSRWLVNIT